MNLDKIYKIPGVSELDNLAYRLYWNDQYHYYECSYNFFEHSNKYQKYYDKSIIMLREEKLKKLSKI